MKARTLIITAVAMFAIAAPAAQASIERLLPVTKTFATHHKIVVKSHKLVAKKATSSKAKSTGPLYITFPGSPNQAVSVPGQQVCDTWGEDDCLTVAPSTQIDPAPAANPQTQSVAATTETAPANDSSTDNSDEEC